MYVLARRKRIGLRTIPRFEPRVGSSSIILVPWHFSIVTVALCALPSLCTMLIPFPCGHLTTLRS